jgi:hypothetical protein
MALPSANGSASRTLGLKFLRVQGKGGRTDPGTGPGRPAWADRPRPLPARFGRPFAPVGPQVIMHFAPSICMILTMSSSRPRWRFTVHEVRSFTLQSPRVFLRSTSVLATIGSDFMRPRWRFTVHEVRSFTLQSPRVFLRSTSVLATIRSDFIKLMNSNKTP